MMIKVELKLSNLETAEGLLKILMGMADKYGFVSIADYNDQIGVVPSIKDNLYGWGCDSLKDVKAKQVDDGYLIKFPPVEDSTIFRRSNVDPNVIIKNAGKEPFKMKGGETEP